jgi:hypothetical protein
MIFPILKSDLVVQVGDKLRLDSSKTFITPDEAAITLIEIEPDTGLGFFDVTAAGYLNWVYSTGGDKTATLRVTTNLITETIELNISCLTAVQDKLFSSDNDLMGHESKIYDYLPKEYSSFNHLHRSSQSVIMDSLTQRGYEKAIGVPLTKADIFNVDEVKQWSKFLTLSTIFSASSNEVNDFFSVKAQQYKELAERSAQRAYVTLDTDQDGQPDTQINLTVGRLVRR